MHIPNPFKQSNQRGDTVVEVLIALAIISSVLTGAFFVTNRSTQNVRDTEEHTQALQLLQGQIELLRSDANDGTLDSGMPTYFCYDSDQQFVTAGNANDYSKCPNDLDGSSGVAYQFLTIKGASTPASTTFTASVKWDGFRGQTNTEHIIYKVALKP